MKAVQVFLIWISHFHYYTKKKILDSSWYFM